MEAATSYAKRTPSPRTLNDGDTTSIDGEPGIVVRCLAGRVWITHEGDVQDYVVPAGMRYQSARRGRIVASALSDGTCIAVYRVAPAPAAAWARNGVQADPGFIEQLQRAARREMALWFAHAVGHAWRAARTFARRIARTARRAHSSHEACMRGSAR